jgi:hypothetical protein
VTSGLPTGLVEPAHSWELREETRSNGNHDGRRHEIWILLDEDEATQLMDEATGPLTYQQFLDACRMFLFRGYRLAVRYPEHRSGFPSFERFVNDL